MSVNDLKICPFCGGEPYLRKCEIEGEVWEEKSRAHVYCTRCFASTKIERAHRLHDAVMLAKQNWNKRVDNDRD